MKRFFKFAAIAAAAFAIISCEKDPQGGNNNQGDDNQTPDVEYTENLEFTLEVTSTESDQAKIKVSHTGTTKDTWYGFATTETNVATAITAKVAELTAEGDKISGLKKNKTTTVTVRDLEAETEYTFIVFAITEKGTLYGTSNSIKFKTSKAPVEGYQINPNWTVQYIGDYEFEGQTYENVAAVESTDDNTFFVTAWPKDLYDEYGIETIAQLEIETWAEYLTEIKATWNDVIRNESTVVQVLIDLEFGSEWYVIAIGADSEGYATGLYAISELVTIVEDEPTEGYAAWIGDWTITGANGLTQNVTFSKGKVNKTFKMSGYEGPETEGLDVTVDWFEEEGCWAIYNQKLGTFNFGSDGPGDIWFVGEDANENLYLSDELPICIGGALEDGTLEAYGYEESWENEDGSTGTYKVNLMEYLVHLTDSNQLSYITYTFQDGYPTFPLTFTTATTANKRAAKEFKSGTKCIRNLNSTKEYQVYGSNKTFSVR